MSTYKSPFSVNYRTPVYIDARDPRASAIKKEKNIAKYGRQVVIVDNIPAVNQSALVSKQINFIAATGSYYGYGNYNQYGYLGASSSDGIKWDNMTIAYFFTGFLLDGSSARKNWTTGIYGGGKFLLFGNGYGGHNDQYYDISNYTQLYSYNGKWWTEMNVPYYSYNNDYRSICYGQGKFIAITSTTTAIKSIDGITWTLTSLPTLDSGASYSRINYLKKLFVVSINYSGLNKILSSTDSVTWNMNTIPLHYAGDIAINNNNFVEVNGDIEDRNNFVVIDTSGNSLAAYSTDLVTWTLTACPNNANAELVYGNGIFLSISPSSTASYSTDGIIWQTSTMPSSGNGFYSWSQLAYGSNKGFVVFSRGTSYFEPDSGKNSAFTTNGITWTLNSLPIADSNPNDIIAGNWSVVVSTG